MSTVVCQYNKKNPESERRFYHPLILDFFLCSICLREPFMISNHILYKPVYSDLPHIAVNICPQDYLEPL